MSDGGSGILALPLLPLLLSANSNEANCQSGSIVSPVNPAGRLLNSQDTQTKARMKLSHTDKEMHGDCSCQQMCIRLLPSETGH